MSFSVRLTVGWEINRIKNLYRYIKGSLPHKAVKAPAAPDKASGSLLLTHVGSRDIPVYASDCVEQVRLFSDIPIYFICNRKKEADKRLSDVCNMIYVEDLPVTKLHLAFFKKLSSHRVRFDNFFQAALERFFVLYDAVTYLGLSDVVHMENDILVYEDLSVILNMLKDKYSHVTVPRMNENDCMASLMYIPDAVSLKGFLEYVLDHVYEEGRNDMNLLAGYMSAEGLEPLPVTFKAYVSDHGLENKKGEKAPAGREEDYYRYSDEFGGIFDAAAIGQFVGGTDRKPGGVADNRGFINQASYVDPSLLDIEWKKTDKGYVPFVRSRDKEYRIFDLHIHCKELFKYRSDAVNPEIK